MSAIAVRTVTELADLRAVVELLDEVWGNEGPPPISLEHLRALSHAGNYVAVAEECAEVVGASVGFLGTPIGRSLHSDVTGVRSSGRGRGVGLRLKLHQRDWALQHGIGEIAWSFDPLVARNAHFNLMKLRAVVQAYAEDFYGDMPDPVNAGQGSDRLLVSWHLRDPGVVRACAGDAGTIQTIGAAAAALTEIEGRPVGPPRLPSAARVTVQIPDDILAVRRADADLGRDWRRAVRGTLGAAIAGGGHVSGFDRHNRYVIDLPGGACGAD